MLVQVHHAARAPPAGALRHSPGRRGADRGHAQAGRPPVATSSRSAHAGGLRPATLTSLPGGQGQTWQRLRVARRPDLQTCGSLPGHARRHAYVFLDSCCSYYQLGQARGAVALLSRRQRLHPVLVALPALHSCMGSHASSKVQVLTQTLCICRAQRRRSSTPSSTSSRWTASAMAAWCCWGRQRTRPRHTACAGDQHAGTHAAQRLAAPASLTVQHSAVLRPEDASSSRSCLPGQQHG